MILFIAPNPHDVTDREGFLQRVYAIDQTLQAKEKHYINDCTDLELAQRLSEATVIYVHSLYQLEKIVQALPVIGHKVILDLHGVVPEEELYSGNEHRSKRMDGIERAAFKYVKTFVAVTNTMAAYYKKKYKNTKDAQWVVLPIFDTVVTNKKKTVGRDKTVVYAGGAQKWQNVDLMIDTINKSHQHYSYDILTHSPDAFSSVSEEALPRVKIESVDSSGVAEHYKNADFGFVLRDDIVVNRVACPTKIIEYLGSGVIPVIKSEYIGDFHSLGYKFFRLKELIEGTITDKQISDARKINYRVYDKLKRQSESGKETLAALVNNLQDNQSVIPAEFTLTQSVQLSAAELRASEMQYQIDEQIRIIGEYKESVDYFKAEVNELRSELESIKNSKSWRVIRKLRKYTSNK